MDAMRPEDHIEHCHGMIVMLPEWEPIDHGFGLWFHCNACGQQWTAAVDFDEMEVAE